jgi:lipoprotein-anchoring transpeptidase ErfK/SrfK
VNGRIPLALGAAGVLAIVAVVGLSIRGTLRPAASDVAAPQVAAVAPAPKATQRPKPAAPPSPAADEPFVVKRILPIEGAIKYGQWHWDEKDVPPGPIVMTVDLEARVLSIFRGGYEIGAAAVLLGTEDKPTPLGVYPITQKDRSHVSNLYDAPMPYMMRLTNDGITLHGSKVEWGYASHGCVGMPEPFAKKVFEAAKLGDRVFITRGKTVGIGESLVAS